MDITDNDIININNKKKKRDKELLIRLCDKWYPEIDFENEGKPKKKNKKKDKSK